MQQLQDFVARPRHHRAGLSLGGALLTRQHGFCKFEIPIAIDVPDETVDRARGVVESTGFDRFGHLARGARRLVGDPAVQRLLRLGRIEAGGLSAAVHLGETAGIP